ncbi:hypothetical protein EV426DRAFT_580293 [Tirmania nivea]|nr:hypothetical protein EV426DRAFT_580293 [Tirmania nivea]
MNSKPAVTSSDNTDVKHTAVAGCAGMPMFTTEHGTPVITEGALQAYAEALKATILPADSPLQTTPDVMVSCLQPKSSNKLVYIGFHHTFVHTGGTVTPPSAGKVNCGTNPVATPIPTPTPFIRGPTDALTGNQKLNSIFRTTLRPANNHSRSLLYGPGVYLTQRPATGNLAAAGGLLGLTDAQTRYLPSWNIVQIHVFVPLQTYFSWRAHQANLIPDCDRFHRNENILRLKQVHGMINSERMSWGLGDEDLIITPPRMITTTSVKRPVIEELVISGAGMKDAKLLAQCIPNKERFLPYMEYRKAHRYDQREDMEWSEVAMRVLEQGVSSSTGEVKRIEDTQTFKDLAPFLADFGVLEKKQWGGGNGKSNDVCGVWEYWRALEAFRDRK